MMDSTLFIVGSPFQCLCMLEAIEHFEITEFDVLIPYGDKLSMPLIENLLKKKGINYVHHPIKHGKDIIPYVMHKHKYYKNIFLGDYFFPLGEALAVFCAKRNFNLFFLDDGTQALALFSDTPPYRYGSKKWEWYYKFLFLVGRLKRCESRNFFTIYDVYSGEFNIIQNEFRVLQALNKSSSRGCYIIGTTSTEIFPSLLVYLDYLKKLAEWFHKQWPEEKIFYCPHRRDRNNSTIATWCKEFGVEWFSTKISVEYDFIDLGHNPRCVVGFTSNALYTLKMIFKKCDVRTLFYHAKTKELDDETLIIRDRFNSKGIDTLYLDDEYCF